MKKFLILLVSNVFALMELLLLIRVVLKALSANAAALVVGLVYSVTDTLIFPFQGIFSNVAFRFGVIDVVAITAMIFYLILFAIIFKALLVVFGRR